MFDAMRIAFATSSRGKQLLWFLAVILSWVFISPWCAVALTFTTVALYVGAWYIILRLLGILR